MLYGRIQDFYVAAKGSKISVVKFLVKNDELEKDNACTVCAEIPNDALKYDMIKAGSFIGWKELKVYIEIEGVEDVPFIKIGVSNGNEVTFYEHLKSISLIQQNKNINE